MPKHKNWFWLAALVAAALFDFLFWQKGLGISFPIWIAVLLGTGFFLAWREGQKPSAISLVLAILIFAFSILPAWRNEPFTRFLGVFLSLTGALLLSATFLTGYWPSYRMVDYFKNMFIALGAGLSRAILLGSKNGGTPPPLEQAPEKQKGKKGWAVVRGLLIALPIVALLALLLSSADPIFADWLARVLNIEKLPQYLFRLFYIVVIGTFLVGLFLHAILPNKKEDRPDPGSPWMKPFLGWTETAVILGAVNLLFLSFVFIQFRYLFGGDVNISETGFTYAEYARKGFGELVAVAVISLAIYLLLNTVSRRETKREQRGFTILAVLLMANVLVMLVSSLQRLRLYEDAYGFSQLRTYTHVFIFCLAGLILTAILLELINRRGHFAFALLITTLAFASALAIMNVNGFIAERNIERAIDGKELDVPHLVSLSSDAVPMLVERFSDPATPAEVKEDLGYALSCNNALMEDPTSQPWQKFSISNSLAWNLLQEYHTVLAKYKVTGNSPSGFHYQKDGEIVSCVQYFMD